jgi:hypothetical protein
MTPKPKIVAYNYPGWHRSPWKDMDEWGLLDERRPLFEGHQPLRTPARGRYDDRDADVLRSQIREALTAGINAFTYFLYFGPDGFVLDEPTRRALEAVDGTPFEIGVTWCLRHPYQNFPVPLANGLSESGQPVVEKTAPDTWPLLSELVPHTMLDTPVMALVAVFHPRKKPSRGKGTEVSRRYDGITLSQIVDMLTKMREIRADGSALALPMTAVEGVLGTVGLVDLPLYTVSTLVRELAATDPDQAVDVSVQVLVEAFGQDEDAQVTPADIRYLAATGYDLAAEIDVFGFVRLADLVINLTSPGLRALSCKDVRVVLEGIAADRAAAERR